MSLLMTTRHKTRIEIRILLLVKNNVSSFLYQKPVYFLFCSAAMTKQVKKPVRLSVDTIKLDDLCCLLPKEIDLIESIGSMLIWWFASIIDPSTDHSIFSFSFCSVVDFNRSIKTKNENKNKLKRNFANERATEFDYSVEKSIELKFDESS